MKVATGTVIDCKVVLHAPAQLGLREGEGVYVITPEHAESASAGNDLSPSEWADLQAGLAEADQGDVIPAAKLWARLRRHEQR